MAFEVVSFASRNLFLALCFCNSVIKGINDIYYILVYYSHQAEPYDSKAGADLMEIILAKVSFSSPVYFIITLVLCI